MGNSVARNFKQVELERGTVPKLDNAELIAPGGSWILGRSMKVIVRRDEERKSTIFFDCSTMCPLYITSKKRNMEPNSAGHSSNETTLTKDSEGRVLFLTETCDSGKKKLIYKAPSSIPLSSDSSHSSSSSTTSSRRCDNGDVPCSAQIDISGSGASRMAFFSLIVWKGNGPELLNLYKAMKIPQVKYGVLVADMEGHVVGKAHLDEHRMQPIIKVSAGSDLPSVLATASALIGEF